MALTYVHNKLAAIDYNPRHLSTYLAALTPGLSILIQKVQMTALMPTLRQDAATRIADMAQMDRNQLAAANNVSTRLTQICRGHYAGAFVQLVNALAIAALASAPLVGFVLGTLACYQLINTMYDALKYESVTYRYTPAGALAVKICSGFG